jgi:hypothetical protein
MANLTKYTLSHNEKTGAWELRNDATKRKVASFGTKAEAVKGGALEKAVGKTGGSVKVQNRDGKIQENARIPARQIRGNHLGELRVR